MSRARTQMPSITVWGDAERVGSDAPPVVSAKGVIEQMAIGIT